MHKLNQLLSHLKKSEKVVISDHERYLTGPEFVAEVKSLASELQLHGVANKRSVLLRMTNTVDSVTMLFGALMSEGVVYVANPYDPMDKLDETVTNYAPYLLLSDQASAKAIKKRREASMPPKVSPIGGGSFSACVFEGNDAPPDTLHSGMGDANIAIFSSGTTGNPKAILHKVDSLLSNAMLHAESIGLRAGDVVGCVLPTFYSYGLVANLFAGLMTGSHLVLHAKKEVVQESWIVENQVSVLALTPYFGQALKLSSSSSSLRVLTFGGDVLYSKVALDIMHKFSGCELFATYGLTEAGPRVATWRFDAEVLAQSSTAPIGKPLRGVDLSIRRSKEGSLSPRGELIVDTPTRMAGYFYGVEKGFVQPEWPGTQVHTGDLFEAIGGNIFFVGRKKDIIVQSGEKLFPLALESVIQSIDGVIDVRVEGIAHQLKGQIAKAFIHAEKHVTPRTVKKALLRKFSHSTLPEEFEFVPALPRTATGKRSRMLLQRPNLATSYATAS